ncbi:MAG TPA: hypothetical protein VFW86_01355 [Candidatus Limnocylindrales bacterium]|nr:hypothetical protein [Candidatus Limnocylindrales bacterium]
MSGRADDRRTPTTGRPGRVRIARLTDLAALGELSRRAQGDEPDDGGIRSLGLPVSGTPIGIFSLFRLPLGAIRQNDALYVYEEDRRIAGLLRVERDPQRDEWTIVELDAIGLADAGDIRYRLVQHLLRDAAKRGAARLHVACADHGGNVELFMQAGFARYGEEWLFFRPPGRLPAPMSEAAAAELRIRPAEPLDALPLSRLHGAATPTPVARLEGYRLRDWERQAGQPRIPRSSLTPILRFADVSAYVQAGGPDGEPGELAGFVQVGVAKEDQPHYLRLCVRPDHDARPLLEFGLGAIAEATASASRMPLRPGPRQDHGVVAPVRTYESPVDARLEEAGFERIAAVTLLMKETLVRVAEPSLVPAVR